MPAGVLALLLVAGLAGWGSSVVIGRRLPEPPPWPDHLDLREPRVVVLKSLRRLHLFDGDRLVRTYPVGLGHEPSGPKRKANDGRTPEGLFYVCAKNPGSEYHRFIGISYPNAAAAQQGYQEGRISPGELNSILSALSARRCPPWTTALGGGIGIHGHGATEDWTAGCIALSDEDAAELFAVLRPGDVVEILP